MCMSFNLLNIFSKLIKLFGLICSSNSILLKINKSLIKFSLLYVCEPIISKNFCLAGSSFFAGPCIVSTAPLIDISGVLNS